MGLMLAISCEMEFDIKDLKGEPQFYVESIFYDRQDTVEIVVKPTYPATGKPKVTEIPDDLVISLSENGIEREVLKADKRFDDHEFKWFFTGGFSAGSEVEINVSGGDYRPASAVVTVPEKFDDFTCSVENYTDDNAVLNIRYRDSPENHDFYAVSVLRNVRIVLNDGTVHGDSYYSIINTADLSDDLGEYQYKYLTLPGLDRRIVFWNDSREELEGYKTMTIYISQKQGPDSWEYRGDSLGGSSSEVLGMAYVNDYVTVYRLDPKTYRYLSGKWNEKYNDLAGLGLAPPSFTYTNIDGGIGGFVPMTASEPYRIDWSGY